MIHQLESVYEEGKPSDEQTKCIETFFNETDEFWQASELQLGEGSDEETQKMIEYFFCTIGGDAPQHIRKMITDWQEEGF
jgi:hypothetical protein